MKYIVHSNVVSACFILYFLQDSSSFTNQSCTNIKLSNEQHLYYFGLECNIEEKLSRRSWTGGR